MARTGIGVDDVDIDAATRAGIVVTNVPEYCEAGLGPRDGDVAHAGSQDSFRPKQVARMFSSKEPRYPVNLKQLQAQKK